MVPRIDPRFPHGGVEHARVLRIHRQVDRADLRSGVEDPLPMLPAVARAVDTAFLIRTEAVSKRRDVDQLGVGRMDPDLGDVLSFRQPHVLPALAVVHRAVHAVAMGDVGTQAALAHPDVDDAGIGLGDRQRPDRGSFEVRIRDVAPARTRIVRPPDPPAACPGEVGSPERGVPLNRHYPATPVRSNKPPPQRRERRHLLDRCHRNSLHSRGFRMGPEEPARRNIHPTFAQTGWNTRNIFSSGSRLCEGNSGAILPKHQCLDFPGHLALSRVDACDARFRHVDCQIGLIPYWHWIPALAHVLLLGCYVNVSYRRQRKTWPLPTVG